MAANLVRTLAGPAVFDGYRDRTGVLVARIVVAAIVVGAVCAPLLVAVSPTATDLGAVSLPPFSEGHLLGTDALGRDLLARTLWGGRPPILIALASVAIGLLLGAVLGLLAGYLGGPVDHLLGRLADIQLSIPGLVLALVFLSIYGTSAVNVVVIIAIESWPLYFRVLRAQVGSIRGQAYIDAARLAGVGHLRVVARHVVPNAAPVLVVVLTLNFTTAVLAESSLSFLGVGIQPPTPDWGVMISEGQGQLGDAWWVALVPGAFLVALLLGFQVIADDIATRSALRDVAVAAGGGA